ncbi:MULTISPECIES: hypothetical protein [Brevibacillus]|nr:MULTISPECIES: hypothetical protein [Brevibacillus]PSJ66973.1 hypothetical protein C7J99_23100 [Brevibacillus brevis]RED27748.1 hypothetical protein DES34_10940 [Brevibacillus brevis]TQK42114.1 hypothetical protein FB479_115106 [Brevibacillus sp. AG162]VEF86785.1 Uncharacterised protein [Brevibacillus brevis]GEC88588.1 hypothetical protein BBR01nite_09190 [Brevibacillus brevis]
MSEMQDVRMLQSFILQVLRNEHPDWFAPFRYPMYGTVMKAGGGKADVQILTQDGQPDEAIPVLLATYDSRRFLDLLNGDKVLVAFPYGDPTEARIIERM